MQPNLLASRSRRPLHVMLNPVALASAMVLAGIAPWTVPTAHAQQAGNKTYSIPAGPLGTALSAFAGQSGVSLSFTAEQTRDFRTPGLQGARSIERGFAELLAGTGLQAVQRDGSAYMLQAAPAAPSPQSSADPADGRSLAAVTVTAVAERSETTEGTGSYTTRATSAATGLPLSPRETPQSLEVVTRQRMDDQRMHSLTDVLRTTTGVAESAYDSERSAFSYRGFGVDTYLYDGVATTFSSPYAAGESELDSAIYDRVEIVRGATGLLTGAGNPGASVNLVRKRATSKELTGEINLSAGSWDNYRGDLDLSAPLTADGRVRGRLVTSGQTAHSFVDRQEKNKGLVYGTIEADLTPDTLLRVGADYQQNRPKGSSWGGLPIWFTNGEVINWNRSTNLSPDWNHWDTTTQTRFASLDHVLSNGWKTHVGYTYSKQSYDAQLAMAVGNVNASTWSVSGKPYSFWYRGAREQHALDAKAEGSFELLGRQHELVVGGMTSRQQQLVIGAPAEHVATYSGSLLAWDGSFPKPTWGESYVESEMKTRQTGLYSTVRLSLADPLKVILGSRYSVWDRDTQSRFTHLTPYAGVVYDINDRLSLYASYTDIFQPQDALDRNGAYLDPITGKSRELGVKTSTADNRFNASFAVFDIVQNNLAQVDADAQTPDGLSQAYYGAKGANSKGFEFELGGEILPGWNAKLGYVHYTLKDRNGQQLSTTLPRSILDLFTTYRFGGAASKLTIGGGMRYQSDVWGLAWGRDSTGTSVQRHSEQNSYALVNLMARYEFTPTTSLQVNLNNLFDKTYLTQVAFYSTKSYGAPRNVLVTLSHKF